MTEPDFLYDDAYITLASAQALWLGHDPHFPGTPALYGATSPFHCVLVALLLPALHPPWALLASCLLGAAVYASALWTLARHEGLRPTEAGGLLVAGLGAGMMSQHLANGLETSWAMAAVAWMVTASRRGQPTLLAVVSGTAPFIRPELAVIAAALVAYQVWQMPSRTRTLAIVGAASAAPWLLLLWAQTGAVVPATLAAKRDWYAEGCWPASRRLEILGQGLGGWLWSMPVLSAGLVGLPRTKTGRIVVCAAVAILLAWAWSVPNVLHSYQRHRYLVPLAPLLLFGLMGLPLWLRPALVGLAAVAAVISAAAVWRFEPAAVGTAMDVRTRVGQALRQLEVSRVLLHDAGYLAYSDAMPEGVDMVGLKTPLASTLHARLTGPSCGANRRRALLELAEATRPTHLVIWQPWDDYFGVTDALAGGKWNVTKRVVIDAKEPIVVYSLTPPGDHKPRLGT